MNAKVLAGLALKIWGITVLVGALASFPAAVLMATAGTGNDSSAALSRAFQIGSVLQLVMRAAAGLAVVVWSDKITDVLHLEATPLHVNTNIRDLQILGFGLVGVVVLVQAFENIAAASYVWVSRPRLTGSGQDGSLSYLWARQNEAIVRALVQLVVGALLLFGSKSLVDGWSRLRGQSVNEARNDSDLSDPPAT